MTFIQYLKECEIAEQKIIVPQPVGKGNKVQGVKGLAMPSKKDKASRRQKGGKFNAHLHQD